MPGLSVRAKSVVASHLLVLVACSSAPISYSSTTPKPLDATYACALSKINELGYSLSNTNKDAGFIVATHQTSSGFSEALSGQKMFDKLTVAIFDDPKGAGKTLRVTAATAAQKAGTLFGNASESGDAPSKAGKDGANAILAACAPGTVKIGGGKTAYIGEAVSVR